MNILFTCHLSPVILAYAEVIESIVAIINDDLILLSEFREALDSAKKADSTVSEEEVLTGMIDNMLLLNEAKKIRIAAAYKSRTTAAENEAVIQEYIDKRIKALIHIPYSDIEHYYRINADRYGDKNIIDVRDEIEARLVEIGLKTKLSEFLVELRKKSYIRIQLNQ